MTSPHDQLLEFSAAPLAFNSSVFASLNSVAVRLDVLEEELDTGSLTLAALTALHESTIDAETTLRVAIAQARDAVASIDRFAPALAELSKLSTKAAEALDGTALAGDVVAARPNIPGFERP